MLQVQQGSAHKKKKVQTMDIFFFQRRHFFKNIIFLKT